MDCCGCWRCLSACGRSGLRRQQEVYHVRPAHHFSPPSSKAPIDGLWTQLPACNRQRVIWLFSQVLAQQVLQTSDTSWKEASHDRAPTTPV
jgi:hypothetical protein